MTARAILRAVTPERGFTLLEVLVAGLLLTIGVVSVMPVFPQALRSTRKAGEHTVLNHLAAQQLLSLRSAGYDSADMTVGTHPALATDANGDYFYPVPAMPENYSMRWIVSAGPTDEGGVANPRVRTVAVEATYRMRYTSGGTRIDHPDGLESTFRTFIAE